MGLLFVAVVAVGCSRAPAVPTFGGQQVAGLGATVSQADVTFRAAALAGKATLAPGSACSVTEAGRAITGGWCGPVAYPGDAVGDDWQALDLVPHGRAPVALTASLGAHGEPAPVGSRLVRPGEPVRTPPSPSLPADAAVLAPGQLAVLGAPGVPLTPPADGRLRAETTSVVVEGVARTRVAGEATSGVHVGAQVVTAPAGHVLAVATFTITIGATPLGDEANHETGFAVVADGTSLPINRGMTFGGGPLTVTVPIAQVGGTAVLEVTEGPLTERFDLVAGRRVEPAPAVLYRDATLPFVALGAGQSATATVHANGTTAPAAVTLRSASLQDLAPDGAQPPGPGQAWLVAKFDGPSEVQAADGTSVGLSVPPAPFLVAVLPDGTRSGPHAALSTVTSEGFLPSFVWFAVPAGAARVTLVVDGQTIANSAPATIDGASFDLSIAPAAAPTTVAPGGPTLAAAVAAQLPLPVPSSGQRRTATGPLAGVLGVFATLVVLGLVVAGAARRRRRPPPIALTAREQWGDLALRLPARAAVAGGAGARGVSITDASTVDAIVTGPGATGQPLRAAGSVPAGPATGGGSSTVGEVLSAGGSATSGGPGTTGETGAGPGPTGGVRAGGGPLAGGDLAHWESLAGGASTAGVLGGATGGSVGDGGGGANVSGHVPLVGEVLRIRVLGTPEVTGWAHEPGARAAQMVDIAACLAVHPDGIGVSELHRLVWRAGEDDSREVSRDTVTQTLSRFRRMAGPKRMGAVGPRGYTLGPGVEVDWWRFRRLVADAERSLALDPPATDAAVDALGRALAMVRGPAFQGASANGPFAWVFEVTAHADIQRAVVDAAHRLATLALAQGDPTLATWAASRVGPPTAWRRSSTKTAWRLRPSPATGPSSSGCASTPRPISVSSAPVGRCGAPIGAWSPRRGWGARRGRDEPDSHCFG